MNGQMRKFDNEKYLKSLANTVYEKLPKAKTDLRGMKAYAESKHIDISELSQPEKMRFVTFY